MHLSNAAERFEEELSDLVKSSVVGGSLSCDHIYRCTAKFCEQIPFQQEFVRLKASREGKNKEQVIK